MTHTAAPAHAQAHRRRWRLDRYALITAVTAVIGVLALSYPSAASWFAQVNQSQVIRGYLQQSQGPDVEHVQQLAAAREYNAALNSGAILEANTHVPTGDGLLSDDSLEYDRLLVANSSGLMARLQIPSIDVDLPIYHGSSDAVLMRGAGHLQGTSLPVGGESTRAVITAHRGLANARMFTDLDQLKIGDTFTFEVLGEVLSYRVVETQVVAPDDRASLRVVPGRDLATLVTCTPLGVNSHRILVTGERVYPTPQTDIDSATADPQVPRFPWWAVWAGSGIMVILLGLWWSGRPSRADDRNTDTEHGSHGAS